MGIEERIDVVPLDGTLVSSFERHLAERGMGGVEIECGADGHVVVVGADATHLALVGDRVVGSVRFVRVGPREGMLFDLYVFPEARGRGIATMLVRSIARAVVTCHPDVILGADVKCTNRASKTAFARAGFVCARPGAFERWELARGSGAELATP